MCFGGDFLFLCFFNKQSFYHTGSFSLKNICGGYFVDVTFSRDHCTFDRVSAHCKEVIICAHVLNAKDLFKSGAQSLLHIRFRCSIFAFEASCLRRIKRFPVKLSIGVHRELIQFYKKCRYHIWRQFLSYCIFDILRIHRLIFNIIGNKINLSVLVFKILYSGVGNTMCIFDYRLYLSRLNTLSVYLHHPVLTVKEDNVALFVHFNDISGMQQFIKAVLLLEGVGGKGLCGLLGKVQISVGKITGKAKLALLGFVPVFIENMDLYASKRLADRGIVVLFIYPERQRSRCRFGLTVHNDQLKLIGIDIAHTLGACHNGFQIIALLLEHSEHFRAYKHTVYLIVVDIICQQHRITHRLIGHEV